MTDSVETKRAEAGGAPANGTPVYVAAGAETRIAFTVQNDAPLPIAYHLDVLDLGPQWVSGAGVAEEKLVGAFSEGTLTLRLHPPADASAGEYAFRARVLCEDAVVDPPGERSLRLMVEAAPRAAQEGADQRGEIPEPAAAASRREGLSTPIEPQAKRPDEPKPRAGEPAPLPEDPPPPKNEAAVPQPTAEEGSRRNRRVAEEPPPEVREWAHKPEEQVEEEAESEPIAIGELILPNPVPGRTIELRPGDAIRIQFNFTNEATTPKSYVIEEGRELPVEWITLTQRIAAARRGAPGTVEARLHLPPGAEPGQYPFTLSWGPQDGGLEPCYLILIVQAIPSVRISVKEGVHPGGVRARSVEKPEAAGDPELRPAVVRTVGPAYGPFARSVDFTLEVEREGNVDTAFRISVKDPDIESQKDPRLGSGDIDQSERWSYHFDSELENLESPGMGMPAPPRSLRLTVRRKGIWWWGFRESERVRVAAAPVTDPKEGGDSVELVAKRWRLLPVPGFVALVLAALLVILLGSSPGEIQVVNGKDSDLVGSQYRCIIQDVGETETVGKKETDLNVSLAWTAPFYAVLGLTASPGDGAAEKHLEWGHRHDRLVAKLDSSTYSETYTYQIGGWLHGGSLPVHVLLIPARTRGKLGVGPAGVYGYYPSSNSSEPFGDATTHVHVTEVTVSGVSRHQYTKLLFWNSSSDQMVQFFVFKRPKYFDLSESGVTLGTHANTIKQYSRPSDGDRLKPFPVIKLKPTALTDSVTDDVMEFVTSDADAQILRIKFEFEPAGP